MKTKFTPAPWYIIKEDIDDGNKKWRRWDIFSESSPFSITQTSSDDPIDKEENEANMRLIAKAPELFNALKALVESMDGAMCGHKEELKNAKKILEEVMKG